MRRFGLWALLCGCALGCDKKSTGGNGDETGLDAHTRFAFIANGVPVVTDTDGDPVLSVLPPGESYGSLTYVHLNRTGTALGFSLSVDNVNIRPYGTMIDPLADSITAVEINSVVSRSKGPIPDDAGETWGWIQYGGATSPSNLIRLTNLEGASKPGDATAGWTQVWGYGFLKDGRFVTIYSDNSTDGPLWAFDPSTLESEQLSETEFFDFIEVGLDDRVLGTIGMGFGIYDPSTASTAEHRIFPWEDPDLCPTAGPSGGDPLCYFEMLHPDWSADGTKVVYMGRSGLVTYDDRDGDVFVHDVASGEYVRITDDEVRDWTPRFSADGAWVYWLRDSSQLVRAPSDGSGEIEVVWQGDSAGGQLQVAWPGM